MRAARSLYCRTAAAVSSLLPMRLPAAPQARVAKASLQCLGQVLSALDPANWAAALTPYSQLLAFSTNVRP